MHAVLHLDPELSSLPFAGRTVGAHWLASLGDAGLTIREGAGGVAVHVDGRFIAIKADLLADLIAGGGRLVTASGEVVATVGTGLGQPAADATRTCPADQSHDLRERGGLSRAERVVRRRHAAALEAAGVHLVDPSRVTIDPTVVVAPGALIWPDVVLRGSTRIDAGAEIRPGCWVEDSVIEADAVLKPHSVCTGAHVGPNSQVGPMAHLRPGSVLVGDNKVGNFVEVKKATLHAGAKSSHLTYLGDAEVGANANIGAGTITCNYDGHRKHRTVIGEGAFIGSNSALVAPVTVGAGAIVGAGSTLTRNVPDDALAVVRGPTRVLEGKGKVLNQRNARLKAQEKASKAE